VQTNHLDPFQSMEGTSKLETAYSILCHSMEMLFYHTDCSWSRLD